MAKVPQHDGGKGYRISVGYATSIGPATIESSVAADNAVAREPTQKTPQGVEIPVPTRDAFLNNLRKVAPPAKPE